MEDPPIRVVGADAVRKRPLRVGLPEGLMPLWQQKPLSSNVPSRDGSTQLDNVTSSSRGPHSSYESGTQHSSGFAANHESGPGVNTQQQNPITADQHTTLKPVSQKLVADNITSQPPEIATSSVYSRHTDGRTMTPDSADLDPNLTLVTQMQSLAMLKDQPIPDSPTLPRNHDSASKSSLTSTLKEPQHQLHPRSPGMSQNLSANSWANHYAEPDGIVKDNPNPVGSSVESTGQGHSITARPVLHNSAARELSHDGISFTAVGIGSQAIQDFRSNNVVHVSHTQTRKSDDPANTPEFDVHSLTDFPPLTDFSENPETMSPRALGKRPVRPGQQAQNFDDDDTHAELRPVGDSHLEDTIDKDSLEAGRQHSAAVHQSGRRAQLTRGPTKATEELEEAPKKQEKYSKIQKKDSVTVPNHPDQAKS